MRKTNRESARIHRSGKSCRRPGGSHERNALYLVIYQKKSVKKYISKRKGGITIESRRGGDRICPNGPDEG